MLSRYRGPLSRGVVVAAGVVVNFLLAWACIFGSVSTTGIVKPHYAPGVIINEVGAALVPCGCLVWVRGSAVRCGMMRYGASLGWAELRVCLCCCEVPLQAGREDLYVCRLFKYFGSCWDQRYARRL